MYINKRKHGISLIVLVITIIVMLILSTTVIISLSNNDIVDKANEAVVKTNLTTLQEKVALYFAENYENIDMEKEYSITEFGIIEEEFADYIDISMIKAGKVYIKLNASEDIQKIAKSLNMLISGKTSSNGQIMLDTIAKKLKIYGNSIENNTSEITNVGDFIESQNKYKISMTFTGKNIFDDSSEVKDNTNITEPITISAVNNDVVVSKAIWRVRVQYKDGTYAYVVDGNFPTTFEATPDNPIVQIMYRTTYITSGTYDIQVEFGNTATSYEEYNGKTYDIYLDEPLRKVGNVADYIDVTTGEVVRYIKEKESIESNTISEKFEVLTTPIKEKITIDNLDFTNVKYIFVNTSVIPSQIQVEY